MHIEIRRANESDFESIHLLIKEFATFIKTPEKVTITPQQMKQDKMFFNCIIALADHKIAGFATFFNAFYSWTGRAVYLDDLYVSEKHRGLGIGTKLLNHVIETAKAENCKSVKWQVSNWNQNAIEFYQKMGAITDDVEINCILSL